MRSAGFTPHKNPRRALMKRGACPHPQRSSTSSVTMSRAVPLSLHRLYFWLLRTLGLFMGGIQRYVLYGQYCSRGAGVLTLRLPSLCTWSRSLVLVSSELPCCHSVEGNSSKPCSQVFFVPLINSLCEDLPNVGTTTVKGPYGNFFFW